jgi:5-methylcytosine-specific restriction endonuclease McrA
MGDQHIHAGRSGYRWAQLIKRLKVERPPVCWICGQGINLALHHTHRMSWTADHITPLADLLALGGDPYDETNIAPAHRSCNSRKGRSDKPPSPVNNSRRW